MTNPGTSKVKLQITTHSDSEIAMTRVFDAPGWTMPVCEIDLRVGGQYRYVWRRESNGKEMGMGGVYREIVLQERLVCTELFDEAWYAGESLITTTLVEQGGRTTMTSTMRYVSQEVRDGVLKSGMESGVAASYDRLAELLAPLA